MRWLLHGPMSMSAVTEALRRHEHSVQSRGSAPQDLQELLKLAHQKQLDVLTTDGALIAAAAQSTAKFDRSIVYLQLEGGEVEQDDAIDRLFERYKRLTPGRIYTVTASRVKVRQMGSASR
jgi:hypothetical protein